jgi:replication factor C subunit 3/5
MQLSSQSSSADEVPWVEKYRPKSLSDIVSQSKVLDVLVALVAQDKLCHLILHGPPGTGKTTTALALAEHVSGKANTLEINASDDNGINTVRDTIQRFASTTGLVQRQHKSFIKMVVLDEADSMSAEAQGALRGTIERYSATCRFCFICNNVNDISPAIRSRCKLLRFVKLDRASTAKRLSQIAETEGCSLTADGLEAVLHTSKGDMRIALNTLQACCNSVIDATAVYACTACCNPKDIDTTVSILLSQQDFCSKFNQVRHDVVLCCLHVVLHRAR